VAVEPAGNPRVDPSGNLICSSSAMGPEGIGWCSVPQNGIGVP
jgi:hypothetical protein